MRSATPISAITSFLQPNYHHTLLYTKPLCSVFRSAGHLSIMSQTLSKRGREPEAQMESVDVQEPKRFHGEETDRFLHLLQLDKTLPDDEEEEECSPSEDLVEEVMRSLEEEIGVACSTSYAYSSSGDNNSVDSDISSGHEEQTLDSDPVFDLCYLLDASDDELGIPPSPELDLKYDFCLSPKKVSEGLLESRDLKSLGENWHFEDDFENYQQFALYGDAWNVSQLRDCMNRDFVSQGCLFGGDF